MASTLEKVVVRLEFDNGLTEAGKQKYKAKTLMNIREDAEDTNILEVSKAVSALSEKEVLRTTKVETTLIEE